MSDFINQQPIILASASPMRANLLNSLGLQFDIIPSHCDEEAIKKDCSTGDWIALGYQLAAAKALILSEQYPEQVIIAADQLCVADNRLFDKPMTHPAAIDQLRYLSGKTHQQIACLCLARNQEIIWQAHDIARLTMHPLSTQQIEAYLQLDKPYNSCGAFQYERAGKWLFAAIDGQTDTILGLPLQLLISGLLSTQTVSI